MYKLVIFDLDGTLLDTIGDLSAAGNYALERMKLPLHEESEYKMFVGNGIPKLIERMLPAGHTAQDEKTARAYFDEYYSAHKTDKTRPYDGMTALVKELGERGVICVCNTNKAHEFSAGLIRGAYGDGIREVIGEGMGFPTKPSPDAALEFCRRHCGDKKKVLYVGDSSVDMQTAANAGIDACGVLWGFRSREELESCHPAHIAASVSELRGIILGE